LSGRGLCDELITRPEESYRLWCVIVWDLETSRMGAPHTHIYIYDISSLRVNYTYTQLDSSVGIVTTLQACQPRNHSSNPCKGKFLLPECSHVTQESCMEGGGERGGGGWAHCRLADTVLRELHHTCMV